jgi:hypothetical protein
MEDPGEAPAVCPVCEHAFDSVSVHDSGVMINLLDNERYQRVCLEPISDGRAALLRFYHHTHA